MSEELVDVSGKILAVDGRLAAQIARTGTVRADAGRVPVAVDRASKGTVAVVPIFGFLWQGKLDAARAQVLGAASDKGTRGIVLAVDSQGGEVFGIQELHDAVTQARRAKPIVAAVSSLAASAAYWAASAAHAIVVTVGGEVGSIGVYGMHVDTSKALDQAGLKVTLISAGEGKTAGSPFEPLADDARAEMQAGVDRYYGMFVNSVSRGRVVSSAIVRQDWKARTYGARQAVDLGLADEVGTMAAALSLLDTLGQGGRVARRAGTLEAIQYRRRLAAESERKSYRALCEAQAMRAALASQ